MSGASRKSDTEAEQYGPTESFTKNDSNTRQSFATTSTYSNSLDVSLDMHFIFDKKSFICAILKMHLLR